MDFEGKIGRKVLVSDFIVSRKIEICRGLTRPQWRIDVDLQLDANGLGTAGASERKIQLAGDGIVFEQRLTDSLVHSRPGLRVELQTELADHVGQCVQIRRPIEFRVRPGPQKTETLRKPRLKER